VDKYNKYLVTVLENENLITKFVEATLKTDSTLEQEKTCELELIDQQWTQAKIEAECHCRKINTGKAPWTPSLTTAIYKVLYWKGIQKQMKGGKISRTVLRKRAKQGGETFSVEHFHLATPSLLQKIKTVLADYKTLKKQKDRQEIWLEQMIQAQADAQNTTRKKLWKKIKRTEQSRQSARKVKMALGKQTACSELMQVAAP